MELESHLLTFYRKLCYSIVIYVTTINSNMCRFTVIAIEGKFVMDFKYNFMFQFLKSCQVIFESWLCFPILSQLFYHYVHSVTIMTTVLPLYQLCCLFCPLCYQLCPLCYHYVTILLTLLSLCPLCYYYVHSITIVSTLLQVCPLCFHCVHSVTIVSTRLPFYTLRYHYVHSVTILSTMLPFCYHSVHSFIITSTLFPFCPLCYHSVQSVTILSTMLPFCYHSVHSFIITSTLFPFCPLCYHSVHPVTILSTPSPLRPLCYQGSDCLLDSLRNTSKNIAMLKLTKLHLKDNVRGKNLAINVDGGVVRERRRKADHRWAMGGAFGGPFGGAY